MWVREQKPLCNYPCEQKQTMLVNNTTNSMLLWADEILCATNRTRIEINSQVRQLLGHSEEPQIGDKVINLHNQWKFMSVNENALTNGCIGTIINCYRDYMIVPPYICKEPIPILYIDMETENGDIYFNIPIDYTYLTTGEKFLTPEQEYKLRKNEELPEPPFEFAYGYAITTHRAQGSEWDKILVIEEFFPTEKEEHFRWLYTAITRAQSRCVIVVK